MADTKSNAYKNEKRNYYKALTREGTFICEYVQTKYKEIYHEAASMYNEINKIYPQKPNLRKTVEFRAWKNRIAAANGEATTPIPRPKDYIYNRTKYRDIKMGTHTTEIPTASSESPDTTPPPEENQQTHARALGMTMCLNIPLMQISTQRKEGEQTTDPPLHDQEPPETMDEQPSDPSLLTRLTPQTTDEQPMDPSLFEQINPEIVEKIIREL